MTIWKPAKIALWVLLPLLGLAAVAAFCLLLVRHASDCITFGIESDKDPYGHVRVDWWRTAPQFTPQWTPDGAHIVFGTQRYVFSDSWETLEESAGRVYVAASDGSSLLQITEGDGFHGIGHSPSVSPDGSRIAYSVYKHLKDEERYYEIETSALDGSDRRRLTKTAGMDSSPEWSPDGARIAFVRYASAKCRRDPRSPASIYTIKLDGSDLRNITTFRTYSDGSDIWHTNLSPLVWSPDSGTLAFLIEEHMENVGSQTILYKAEDNGMRLTRSVLEKDRKKPYKGSSEPSAIISPLAWSPDGRRIAYIRRSDALPNFYAVNIISLDGYIQREVAGLEIFDPRFQSMAHTVSWSPDGAQILFSIDQAMYVVGADGSDLRSVGGELYGAWSPDGSRIAHLVPGGSDVVLFSTALDGYDTRVLVRREDSDDLQVLPPGQRPAPVDPGACSAGKAVPDHEANPGLVQDCAALLAMKDRLSVHTALNWDADTPIGLWEQVTVGPPAQQNQALMSENPGLPRRVLALALPERGLRGLLPVELANLTELGVLNLSSNELLSSIPPEIGSMARLQELDLSGNSLSGTTPLELALLAKLTALDLSGNGLSGPVPLELGDLTELTTLDLSGNGLSGPVPPELGNLAELTTLDLSENGLDGPIPPELGNLAELTTLDLSENGLDGPIPPELGNLAELTTLDLDYNGLEATIPPELGNLTELTTLDLSGNDLDGPIPLELGRLTELTTLDLDYNGLEATIPPELGNLKNLTHLGLRSNRLHGPIPPELGSLEKLFELDLDWNQLGGPIPPELGNLKELRRLFLLQNSNPEEHPPLTGCVPLPQEQFSTHAGPWGIIKLNDNIELCE